NGCRLLHWQVEPLLSNDRRDIGSNHPAPKKPKPLSCRRSPPKRRVATATESLMPRRRYSRAASASFWRQTGQQKNISGQPHLIVAPKILTEQIDPVPGCFVPCVNGINGNHIGPDPRPNLFPVSPVESVNERERI